MKAVVFTKHGSPDVLRLKEVEKPAPLEDEVLIRVQAASINSRDWRILRADPFVIRLMKKPRNSILGIDAAGRVEAVGSRIRRFRPGDEVFGCVERYGGGTFAEYACAGEDEITLKPASLSFAQAAAAPLAFITALQGLRDKGNVRPGQKVLIYGASGGVGTFAVQLAKWFGAEVTAVCSSRNVDLVRSLGAERVIDYTKEKFSQDGQRYDLILSVNGYRPLAEYLRALTPEGTYVFSGGGMGLLLQTALAGRGLFRAGKQAVRVLTLARHPEDLDLLKELLETQKVVPVIDACYPLEHAVEAFRHYEKVHPKGKLVLTME